MNNYWNYVVLNNAVLDWLIAIGIVIGAMILLRLFQSLIVRKLTALSARTKTTIDDFVITTIRSSVMPLLYVLAVYFGSVDIKKPRYALVCGLIADLVGLIAAIMLAYLFFGHTIK